MGELKHTYKILVGKPRGKSPFARPTCKQKDNSKMNLKEIG
jgi:hypothetical protein